MPRGEVIVDRREHTLTGKRIAEKLEKMGLTVKVKRLLFYNYVVLRDDSSVPILRLNVKSFIAQSASRELNSLAGTYATVIVEYSDPTEVLGDIGFYDTLLKHMVYATQRLGLYVIPVHEMLTPKLIYYVATAEGRVLSRAVDKTPSSDPVELALGMLMTLPSIGPKTAARLLYAFGSLRNLANADVNDIARVEGVGIQRAEMLHQVFNAKAREDEIL
jgi:Fanconi anemia group M protein